MRRDFVAHKRGQRNDLVGRHGIAPLADSFHADAEVLGNGAAATRHQIKNAVDCDIHGPKYTTISCLPQQLKSAWTNANEINKLQPMVESNVPQYQQFGQRLTERMKAAEVSIRAMSAELGVSYESVRKWTRGYALPEDHRRPAIASILGTTVADLFAFVDGGHRAEEPRAKFNLEMKRVRTHPWPIVSWVSAGLRSEAVEAYHVDDLPTEEFTAEPTRDGYALVVKGDSMVREDGTGFPPGTIIAIEPRRKPKAGDYVVVRFNDTDEATFKQYVPDGPLKLLKALNKAWPTQQLSPDAVLCGVVVEARIIQRF